MKTVSFEELKNTIIAYVESVDSVRYVDLTEIIAKKLDIGPAIVPSVVKQLVDFGKLEGISDEGGFGWKYIQLPEKEN